MRKKTIALLAGAALAAFGPVSAFAGEAGEIKVGIVQFIDHASLNQIRTSLEARLGELEEEQGVDFNYEDFYYNGNGDASTLQQIGADLIAEQVDVIVAIATPAAQIMQAAAEDTDIPIVFSAVSDPVTAGLAKEMDAPGMNITGTSDALNTATMMELIFANDPEADYIGLLYSKSEDASRVPIEEAKAFLDEKGVKYIEKTGTTVDEVSAAVDALTAEGVDAIFTPTDNTVMNAELAIYEKLLDAGIPHYCGADSFALNGAFLGFGINYEDLGAATAEMVCEVTVGGADPAATPVRTFDNGIATINTDTAEALGIDTAVVEEAFGPFCSDVLYVTTAKEFE